MRRHILPAVLVLMAGCDLTGPELQVPGTYELSTIDGVALPHPMPWEDRYGVRYERDLTAARIVFDDSGRYDETLVMESAEGPLEYWHWGTYTTAESGNGLAITLTSQMSRERCQNVSLTHAGLSCEYTFGRALYVRR